jgi:hypothetical protein
MNQRRLEESSMSITRSRQMVDDIEQQGIIASTTLRKQRDQIENATAEVEKMWEFSLIHCRCIKFMEKQIVEVN